jgi:uncharacterized protein (DUF433 family)
MSVVAGWIYFLMLIRFRLSEITIQLPQLPYLRTFTVVRYNRFKMAGDRTMIVTPTTVDVPLRIDEHGKIRVGSTRVLLEFVIHAFQQGETAEGILDSYPALKLAEVYAVLAYYLAHRTEVDAYVQQADQRAERIQRETEAAYSPNTLALRDRMRALREQRRRSDG